MIPVTGIRVELPAHLRTLAGVRGEIRIELAGEASFEAAIRALEALYPALRGTVRDAATGRRRGFLRFFAGEEDLSHLGMQATLPDAVIRGKEVLMVVGAVAGGKDPAHRLLRRTRYARVKTCDAS